jgi:hypothetical protein
MRAGWTNWGSEGSSNSSSSAEGYKVTRRRILKRISRNDGRKAVGRTDILECREDPIMSSTENNFCVKSRDGSANDCSNMNHGAFRASKQS